MLLNPYISLVIPIIGCIISGFFGRFFGRGGAIWITTGSLIIAAINAWLIFFNSMSGYQFAIDIASWFPFLINNRWFFSLDSLSIIMFVVVLTVSSLVHFYSINYMAYDPHIVRFFTYLSLFTIFMLLLVSGSNLVILFVGWEGVGLCSYLLINFWYTRLQANKAALKAMIVNRVGDISFIAASGLVLFCVGSVNFSTMLTNTMFLTNDSFWMITVAGCLFLMAAVGKSAQIGLHTWLPDAMEGPTPVSALIHAATMVTAGVFLLIRVSGWLWQSNVSLSLTMIFGALTAIFAGSVGLLQFDIKRVIAYSTCSQLGYMILICGGAVFSLGLFHLFNPAFFKAMLFLGAGAVIHANSDEQDMRKYGLIGLFSPFLCMVFLIASLALMGIPFLSGFYSKDSILEAVLSIYSELGLWGYWIGLIAAMFTTAYSFKVAYWTFFSRTSYNFKEVVKNWHSITLIEVVVLGILSILSIWAGFLFKDCFIGFGTSYFFNNTTSLAPLLVEGEFLPVELKLIPLIGIVVILILTYWISQNSLWNLEQSKESLSFYYVYNFLSHKWYFNLLQNVLVSRLILNWGYESFWIWDRWLLEQVRLKNY